MKEKNVIFDTDGFKDRIIPLIEDGLTVPLTVSGASMNPYIVGGRDTVFISKPAFPLKKGDIAFFERENGQIVMHRICKSGDGQYFFVGDAQTEKEGPISEKQIFGHIKKIIRKGKTDEKGSFTWFFFEKIWIRLIPLRPFLMKLYSLLPKKKNKV